MGNVGEFLTPMDDPSTATFLSTDGVLLGRKSKGVYMWEYGDQGTILVLVNAVENTDVLYYSLDEGQT